jgi:hypothetical protein
MTKKYLESVCQIHIQLWDWDNPHKRNWIKQWQLSSKLNDERQNWKKELIWKSKLTRVNSTNLPPGIWDRDNPTGKKKQQSSRPNNIILKDKFFLKKNYIKWSQMANFRT